MRLNLEASHKARPDFTSIMERGDRLNAALERCGLLGSEKWDELCSMDPDSPEFMEILRRRMRMKRRRSRRKTPTCCRFQACLGTRLIGWARPWGAAKRGRRAGPLTPDLCFGKGKRFIFRYRVRYQDGTRKGHTAKWFALARYYAEKKRREGPMGVDIDTYEPAETGSGGESME